MGIAVTGLIVGFIVYMATDSGTLGIILGGITVFGIALIFKRHPEEKKDTNDSTEESKEK